MFNIFKKTESQRITLGLEIFYESEYGNFIKLVKSDLTSRGIVVGGVKDGYLTAKVDGNEQSFGLISLTQNCKLVVQTDLLAIPTRGMIICYAINDFKVVKAISGFVPFMTKLHSEGPGSLSPKLYWYQDDKFTDLPYKIENGKLNFAPPQNFVDMLNTFK